MSTCDPRCMGFSDLFQAAYGRPFTATESAQFAALDQASRNEAVKQMAGQASGVYTEDRIGTDGVTYTAFWRNSAYQAPPDENTDLDNGNKYHNTRNSAADDAWPVGSTYTSFGSKEADGWHKTTVIHDFNGNVLDSKEKGGGAWEGGFWGWASSKLTGASNKSR